MNWILGMTPDEYAADMKKRTLRWGILFGLLLTLQLVLVLAFGRDDGAGICLIAADAVGVLSGWGSILYWAVELLPRYKLLRLCRDGSGRSFTARVLKVAPQTESNHALRCIPVTLACEDADRVYYLPERGTLRLNEGQTVMLCASAGVIYAAKEAQAL